MANRIDSNQQQSRPDPYEGLFDQPQSSATSSPGDAAIDDKSGATPRGSDETATHREPSSKPRDELGKQRKATRALQQLAGRGKPGIYRRAGALVEHKEVGSTTKLLGGSVEVSKHDRSVLKGEAYVLRREVKTRYVQAKLTIAKLAAGYQANGKGFEGGAGASVMELETRYGEEFSKGSARDESLKITGSLGASTPGVICKTTDVDKDGVPELHVGLSGGPLTVEIKTEDPARTFNPVGAAIKDGQQLIEDARKQIFAAATKAFVR